MSTPEENKAVIRRNVEELNRGNVGVLDETYAPAYVQHTPIPGYSEASHKEWEKQIIGMMRAAFPDYRITVEDMVAEGDRVAWRGTTHGTHRGEFMGIPPTGKQIEFGIISIARLEDGKVVENWNVTDQLGFMQQLGVIPTPGQAR